MTYYPRTARYQQADSPGKRRHPLRVTVIVLVIIIALLLIADFGARAYAENAAATQMQDQGFSSKPDVTIDGFPFLTQVLARYFGTVQVTSHDEVEDHLQIQSINITLHGIHLNPGYRSGTVSTLNGVVNITFAELSRAMVAQSGGVISSVGGSLNLSQASSNEVKSTLNLPVVGNQEAVWRITVPNPREIDVTLVNSNAVSSSVLGGMSNIKLPLSSLPLGVGVQSVQVTKTGVVGTVTGKNVKVSS